MNSRSWRATPVGKVIHRMKTVGDVMSGDIVTIHPASTIKTALLLLKGHEIGSLPVVNGEALVGMLELHSVVGRDPSERVADVMNSEYFSIAPDVPVNRAADEMARVGSTRLLVEDQGRLVGVLTHTDLIPELGKSFDPLTGLPWSDSLRQWSYQALEAGAEISVLFFDLDVFGDFNKRYGHVTGDAVLNTIATVLKGVEDQERDLLCRLGGDEFGIASVRTQEEARLLAQNVQDQVARVRVEGIEEPLTISYGVSGGRRTREREAIHYAATIDDLLNRASQECTRMKRARKGIESELAQAIAEPAEIAAPVKPALTPASRVRLDQIDYSSSSLETRVEVTLSLGGQAYKNSQTGLSAGQSAVKIAADACAGAVAQIVGQPYRIAVDNVDEFRLVGGITALVATVAVADAREVTCYYGIAIVRRGELYRAAVASVLSSINRFLGGLGL